MSHLSICIHKPGTKSLDLNEIFKICEQSGKITSLIPTSVFLFINFKAISNIDSCVRKLQRAGYSAEESRKNRKMRLKYGVPEIQPSNESCSEDEVESVESDSGKGSTSSFGVKEVESSVTGKCKNSGCLRNTSSVCKRCSDFFCSIDRI
uniref:Uncharacterized protein n=1 Tax=Megaselia scalaris TaxID=36166 RepID=T1H4F9_MEGSC